MKNKKILIAVTPEILDASMFGFLLGNLNGENLHLTICQVYPEKFKEITTGFLNQFLAECDKRAIPYEKKEFSFDVILKLKSEMAFSDIFFIQKEALKSKTFIDDFELNACPIIMLPCGFYRISNIVLSLDGTRKSFFAIKQFFQLFSNKMERLNVTLLDMSAEKKNELTIEEESMLISYLKLYNSNLAVLKVGYPLTEKSLKPISMNDETLVVGSVNFLILQHGTNTFFKPFYDLRSAVFIPAL